MPEISAVGVKGRRVMLGIGMTLHFLSMLVALAVLLPLAVTCAVVVLPIQFIRACWRQAEDVIYRGAR